MPLAYKPATRIAANKIIANMVTDLIFNLNKKVGLINFFFFNRTTALLRYVKLLKRCGTQVYKIKQIFKITSLGSNAAEISITFKYFLHKWHYGGIYMAVKKKFRCGACNWKFTRNFTPSLCPYCGREAVEEQPADDAGNIVKEVEELGQ
jgi:predicted Zn-ribbon and HTH transcriptional regulator